ncbi:MAG: methyltransferase domain-containing protein [Bacteroidetes bacterium]|nr:methyltransferase domain-containing protein [Bacteroidota bacterium]
MQELKSQIQQFTSPVTFESLRSFITELTLENLRFNEHIPEPEAAGDYGRNIITLEPFECVLIHWPAGVSSAIHLHEGLFGYVWVLEGELDNVFYKFQDGKLIEYSVARYGKNGLIPEPDGVIHKLANNTNTRAITLHFYYPAIESFEGMQLFNVEKRAIGSLSDNANTASWQDEDGHFSEVKTNAFDFVPFDVHHQPKTHVMIPVIPKPTSERIREMNDEYFSEQAHKYDFSDFNQPRRKAYIDGIDREIARLLQESEPIKKVMDIAVGTGRRALHIREISELNYSITGVDISEEMCAIAGERGIRAIHHDWVNAEIPDEKDFDAVTFLYAFGHIADIESRERALRKVHQVLKPGGMIFFDVFSLNNQNEWGPQASKAFDQRNLGENGFDRGDVFYKKTEFNSIAFLHYFTHEEIEELLHKTGFVEIEIRSIGYAKNPGQWVDSDNEGNFFVAARKV